MAAPKDTKSKSIEVLKGLINSPKEKRTQKRQRNELIFTDEEDNGQAKLIGQYHATTKVKKSNPDTDTELAESRKKILDVENRRSQARRQYKENIFESISEITSQIEADYNVMKENEQKLEQIITMFMKCIRQATAANKQKVKALYEIKLMKKQFEEMESEQKEETTKFMEKLEDDIRNLREKFNKESKRKSLDRMRRILQAMQNDD